MTFHLKATTASALMSAVILAMEEIYLLHKNNLDYNVGTESDQVRRDIYIVNLIRGIRCKKN